MCLCCQCTWWDKEWWAQEWQRLDGSKDSFLIVMSLSAASVSFFFFFFFKWLFNHDAVQICLCWWLIMLLHQNHKARYCKLAYLCTISSNCLFKTHEVSQSFSPGFSPGWKKHGWRIMPKDLFWSQVHLARQTSVLAGWHTGVKGRAWNT